MQQPPNQLPENPYRQPPQQPFPTSIPGHLARQSTSLRIAWDKESTQQQSDR